MERAFITLILAVSVVFWPISLPAASPEVLLILDPGHGGSDWGGSDTHGFIFGGNRVSENAYAYDVAMRIARQAAERGWRTFFTVRTDTAVAVTEHNPDRVIPHPRNLFFNLFERFIPVFKSRSGLQHRLDAAADALRLYPRALPVYLSLHFDHVPPRLKGTKIYTAPELKMHPLTRALVGAFEKVGLGYHEGARPAPAVETQRRLYVVSENSIEPRALIEFGNFENPRDRMLILMAAGRELYAGAVIRALERYFEFPASSVEDNLPSPLP